MSETDNSFTYKDSVSLKEYFESRLKSVEKATILAANTLEKRLEGMNEFRDALKNQATLFITKTEIKIQFDKIESDIRMLRESKAMLEGKASQLYVTITFILALVSISIAIISLIFRFKGC